MSGPYQISALTYYEAGFSPLPALGKLLVVKGASGRHPLISKEQVEKWSITHGPFSIALRLPKNVIGLDIDAYKGDLNKLAILEDSLGKLPITWNSDSRGGTGGKILYRVPEEKWISNINGITIVQHTHRYVMAFPSFNKESQTKYVWHDGLGGAMIPDYYIPAVDDLAELPTSWVNALRKQVDPMRDYSKSEIFNDGLDIFPDEEPCTYMATLLQMCKEKLVASYDGGLHDTGLSLLGIVLTAAVNGHSGVHQAVEELSKLFHEAPRHRDLGNEWNNLLSYVLANIDVDKIAESDTCSFNLVLRSHIEQEVSELIVVGVSECRAHKLVKGTGRYHRRGEYT